MGRGSEEIVEEKAMKRKGMQAMDLNEIFASFPDQDPNEPDWRTPNDFYMQEAEQLRRDVVRDYLRSLPGVGDSLADAIIKQLGIKRLAEIDEDPNKLLEIELPGINPQTLQDLSESWDELREEYPAFEMDRAVARKLLELSYDGKFRLYKRWYKGSPKLVETPEKTCPGMSDAGMMLSQAIEDGERIAVFCDYDVDGVTAGEVFRRGVEPYGAKLHYGWADADSGFGLTEDFVREAAKKNCKVLVTLDCGSAEVDNVKLAQDLGMKVVVVDHHQVADNPAEFHLNPQLYDPPSSESTGAQLSWKLAAAVQIAEDGSTRKDHWNETMYLAGMGCMADMGSLVLPENRSFIWSAHDEVPLGVRALAEELGENPEIPGHAISTQACMNLPKRTNSVRAEDVAKLLASQSEEEAKPLVKKLSSSYRKAKKAREKMVEEVLAKTGRAEWNNDGTVTRPEPEKFVSSYILAETEYVGYTGPVASSLSRATAKPAIIFAPKGKNEFGEEIYKFSSRNDSGVRHALGELLEMEEMRAACTITSKNEKGEVIKKPSLGGHPQVVSGSCTKENIDRVLEVIDSWANSKGRDGSQFFPPPYTGADAYPVERKVVGERIAAIEKQSARLGPFSKQKQLAAPRRKGKEDKEFTNRPLEISTFATLSKLKKDPENPGWLAGFITLDNGEKREVRFPEDVDDAPVGEEVEWILRMGGSGPYFLRRFARTRR
jgi:single-stranded DNA-specific DHH superfamily exonuclease